MAWELFCIPFSRRKHGKKGRKISSFPAASTNEKILHNPRVYWVHNKDNTPALKVIGKLISEERKKSESGKLENCLQKPRQSAGWIAFIAVASSRSEWKNRWNESHDQFKFIFSHSESGRLRVWNSENAEKNPGNITASVSWGKSGERSRRKFQRLET